jgi:copper chaperone NosL
MSKNGSAFLLIAALLLPAAPSSAAPSKDVVEGPSCGYCGMDREKYAHSRMLIRYRDGSTGPTCSLRCAAVDLAIGLDKLPQEILVGDYRTKELIDAEAAHWVMGGTQSGVMTRNPKWAFKERADAERFVTENGGNLATFDYVIQAAYAEMYEDTRMIRERRRMRKK